jgi:GMP synthase (glutamine-hydrolysing)
VRLAPTVVREAEVLLKVLVAELGEPETTRRFRLLLGKSGVDVDAVSGKSPLPDSSPYQGLVLGGSPHGVYEREPWMKRLADWALATAQSGRPVLGVCFGHQLLGWALGATVEKNVRGPERGTCFVDLTDEGAGDPLFADLPRRFEVSQIHGDHLTSPPTAPGTVRLASSEHTPWQSFRCRNITGVQFHPEIDKALLTTLANREAKGTDVRDAPLQEKVLANWVRTIV